MSKYIGLSFDEINDSNMQVVVNKAGETIAAIGLAKRVKEAFETGDLSIIASLSSSVPQIVFVRHDGWMLGAHVKFEEVAYKLWKEEWVGFCKYPNDIIRDITEYIPSWL